MTLRELRAMYPFLFHPTQDWFLHEPFMDREAPPVPPNPRILEESATAPLVPAVALALLYVRNPRANIWRRYLWTSDTDREGQRVYIGCNGRGLEIHRHLTISSRWGVPAWP